MLKVAIIGTGGIADAHIAAYLTFPTRCKIIALADIYPEKCAEKNEKYHLSAHEYATHTELLHAEKPDVVSICTPPSNHAQTAIDCIRAGVHVLCEKPLAASLEECDAIKAALEQHKKIIFSSIGQNRFRTPLMRLKKILEQGLIGKINYLQIESYWLRSAAYHDLWWRGTWEKEGGGCTLNHAVHQVDQINWYLGLPHRVTSFMTNICHPNSEAEDFSTSILCYQDKSICQLGSSLLHHGEDQQIVFQGERAKISYPWQVYATVTGKNGFPTGRDEKLERDMSKFYESIPALLHEGHTGQIENVLSAIEQQSDAYITYEAGRNTIELITALYKAATEKKEVVLPISKDDPWYRTAGIIAAAPRYNKKTHSIENAEGDIVIGASTMKK